MFLGFCLGFDLLVSIAVGLCWHVASVVDLPCCNSWFLRLV